MTVPQAPLQEILTKHPHQESSLIMLLQDVQEAYRYLPPEILVEISKMLNIPKAKVFGVATFYKAFSMEPRGETEIKVCCGTACHVRGSGLLMDEFKRTLGVEEGGTTEDGKFTLEAVNCVGTCAMAPVIVVKDVYHGHMSVNKLGKLLRSLNPKTTKKAGDKSS
jgi:NADH:ubiquinone oxidoreductase subunit E